MLAHNKVSCIYDLIDLIEDERSTWTLLTWPGWVQKWILSHKFDGLDTKHGTTQSRSSEMAILIQEIPVAFKGKILHITRCETAWFLGIILDCCYCTSLSYYIIASLPKLLGAIWLWFGLGIVDFTYVGQLFFFIFNSFGHPELYLSLRIISSS